jgi:hypothetical protein
MRLHALVASAAVSAAVLMLGLPVTRLEARGLSGHGAPSAPGRPIYQPSIYQPSYGRPMPRYAPPFASYGRMPARQPAVSYFVEPDHRFVEPDRRFGGWRGSGWRFGPAWQFGTPWRFGSPWLGGSPWTVGPYWQPYSPGFYSGWPQGPVIISMPYRGWGRFHLVSGPGWSGRNSRLRRFGRDVDQDWGGEAPVWSNGQIGSVVSGNSGGVIGSGPDAPYTGSAIYYPPQSGRPKAAADADSDALPPAHTVDAGLPRVIYGIQPQWGAPMQGPHIIYSQP